MVGRFGILLLSDAPGTAGQIPEHLRNQFPSVRLVHVHDTTSLTASMEQGGFDLLIIIHPLGWADGLALPHTIKQRWPLCSAIVIADPEFVAATADAPEDIDALLSDSPNDIRCLRYMVRSKIAQHERMQEVRLKTQAHFRAVFESSLDAMLIADDDGNFVDANVAICNLSGRTREDVLHRGIANLIAPGFDPGKVWADFRKAGRQAGEAAIVRPDGTVRHAEYTATANAIYGRNLITLRDVTERKRAEEALRDSEERFRAIFSNAAIGIVVADMDGRPVLTNRAQQEMLGYTEQELRQMTFQEFTFPEDLPAEIEYFEAVRAGKLDHYDIEKRYTHKYGQTIWASVRVSTIPGSDGKPAYFLVTVENTSPRRQAERAQLESEERFRVTFENAAIGLGLVDFRGIIIEGNPAFHKMLGYDSGDLCGMSVQDITYADDFPREHETVMRLIAGEFDSCQLEKRYVHKNGQLVWARLSLSLVHSADGEPLFAVGLVEDITGSKMAEIEIAQHNRRLTLLNSAARALSASLELSEVLAGLGAIFAADLDLPPGRVLTYENADDCLHVGVQWRLDEPKGGSVPELILAAGSIYESIVRGESPGVILCNSEANAAPAGTVEDPVWPGRVLLPLIADGEVQGVLELVNSTTVAGDEARRAFLKTLAHQIGLALKKSRLHEQACADRLLLQNLSRQLVNVQEDERQNLARELHDEVGSMLAALSISLQMASRCADSKSLNHMKQAQEMVKGLADQIHELSLNLRPALLDDAGLVPALLCHFRRFTEQTAIEVVFTQPNHDVALPHGTPTCAFRVIQEALTNAARHAGVGVVNVSLSLGEDELIVEVSDEGLGFDPGSASSNGTGVGLAGMRERVYAVGGVFTLTSKPGSGTALRAVLPLVEKEVEKIR